MKIIAATDVRLSASVEPDPKTGVMRGQMNIHDAIGGWDGIRPKDVVAKLEELKAGGAKHLDVHIHSPGGDAFDSLAIHNAIAEWPNGEKHTHVDGLAASGGSIIAMAGEKIHCSPNSMLMIHGARGMAIGDAATMRKSADRLEGLNAVMAKLYAKRTGKSEDAISKMMAEETWMDAEAAKKNGFVDQVDGEEKDEEDEEQDEEDEEQDEASARFRAVASALFTNAPAAAMALLGPRASAQPLTPPAAPPPVPTKEPRMTFEELKTQIAQLESTKAAQAEVIEASSKQTADFLAATGKPTFGEALAVVAGLKEKAAKADELAAEIAKRDAEAVKVAEAKKVDDIKAMLDGACKDGRLSPAKKAELEKPEAPAFAHDPVQLKAFLEFLQPQVVTTKTESTKETPVTKVPPSAVLTDEDKRMIEHGRLDPVIYALNKSDPSGQLAREEMASRKKAADAAASKK